VLRVAHVGVNADTPPSEVTAIGVTNLYCMTVALIMLPYVPVFLWAGAPLLAYLLPPLAAVISLPPLFNRLGWHTLARVWMLTASNAIVLTYAWMLGPQTGLFLFFLPIAVAPIMLFPGRPAESGFFGAVPVVLAALLLSLWTGPGSIALSDLATRVIAIAALVTSFFLVASLVYYLARASQATEGDLEFRYRQLVRSAADGLLFLRDDGRIIDANERAGRDLGCAADDLLGKTIDEIDTGLHPGQVASTIVERLEREGPFTRETTYRRHDGPGLPVEVRYSLIRWSGQRHLLAAARDVSERRAMESQLLQADRLAAVGTLAAGVAHEINNPLTYVSLSIEKGKRLVGRHAGTLGPAAARDLGECLDVVGAGVERIGTIVRDLKMYARSETDVLEPVDVAQILDVALALAASALKHRARVERRFSPAPPVLANATRIEQVLLNLVLNAADAVAPRSGTDEPEAPPPIVIELGTAGRRVVVTVADRGSGMTPEVLAHAFDPFFTTKPTGVGTGLGLYVSRSIVESFGGTITIDSVVGQGTRVVVSLPAAPKSVTVAPPSPQVRDPSLPKLRWLIVDDEPRLATVLAELLSEHAVAVATSVDEALARLEAGQDGGVDVILCDVLMPGRSGPELYREVAVRFPGLARRFVFMSGGLLTPAQQAAVDDAGARCLSKPVTLAALHQAVREIVTRAPGESEASRRLPAAAQAAAEPAADGANEPASAPAPAPTPDAVHQ
jgi:PAS domain S-box-containing protein